MGPIILAGDIGATKTVLALYESSRIASKSLEEGLLAESTLRNADFPSFTEALTAFLSKQEAQPQRACFGVTEPTTGLDTTKLKTRAVRQGDRYVVHGQKV